MKTKLKLFFGIVLLYTVLRFFILPSVYPQASFYTALYYLVLGLGVGVVVFLFVVSMKLQGLPRKLMTLFICPLAFTGVGYLQFGIFGGMAGLVLYLILLFLVGSLLVARGSEAWKTNKGGKVSVAGPAIQTDVSGVPNARIGGTIVSPEGRAATFDVSHAVDVTAARVEQVKEELLLKARQLDLDEKRLHLDEVNSMKELVELLSRLSAQDQVDGQALEQLTATLLKKVTGGGDESPAVRLAGTKTGFKKSSSMVR